MALGISLTASRRQGSGTSGRCGGSPAPACRPRRLAQQYFRAAGDEQRRNPANLPVAGAGVEPACAAIEVGDADEEVARPHEREPFDVDEELPAPPTTARLGSDDQKLEVVTQEERPSDQGEARDLPPVEQNVTFMAAAAASEARMPVTLPVAESHPRLGDGKHAHHGAPVARTKGTDHDLRAGHRCTPAGGR